MISNELRDWLRNNSKTINDLARAGHRCCKLIIDAYSQYQRTADDRWLHDLTTNVHTYIRWQDTTDGKAALEGLRSVKARSNEHQRPQRVNQRVNAARPQQSVSRQTKSGRVIR